MPNFTLNRAFVNGDWSVASGAALALIDPDTGTRCGTLISSEDALVHRAVDSARLAFDAGWGRAPVHVRLAVLDRFIVALETRREELAQTISAEIGTPIDFARKGQVAAGFAHLQATRKALASLVEDSPLTSDPAHRARYEPLGVAALITPWNWPLNQVVLKVGAALAAGCTMVLKPSELSSRTAIILAEAAEKTLPKGVFNLILGGGTTGATLCNHREVDIVSFTGSTATGRAHCHGGGTTLCPDLVGIGREICEHSV